MDGLHCAFIGYVGGQPELRYTPNGKAALVFSVAVSDPKGAERGQEATWVRCTAWEETAERLQQQIRKGSELYVEGRLTMSHWQTAGGEQRSGLNVSAWKVEVLGAIGRKAASRAGAGTDDRFLSRAGHEQATNSGGSHE